MIGVMRPQHDRRMVAFERTDASADALTRPESWGITALSGRSGAVAPGLMFVKKDASREPIELSFHE